MTVVLVGAGLLAALAALALLVRRRTTGTADPGVTSEPEAAAEPEVDLFTKPTLPAGPESVEPEPVEPEAVEPEPVEPEGPVEPGPAASDDSRPDRAGADSALASLDSVWSPIGLTDSVAGAPTGLPGPRSAVEDDTTP